MTLGTYFFTRNIKIPLFTRTSISYEFSLAVWNSNRGRTYGAERSRNHAF
jgi:hypothetical protein